MGGLNDNSLVTPHVYSVAQEEDRLGQRMAHAGHEEGVRGQR